MVSKKLGALGLFFSFANIEKTKSNYARQQIQLKKLTDLYDMEDLMRVLQYIADHKDGYNISSLAYIPYIYKEIMALTYAGIKHDEVEFDETISITNNNSKSTRFGQKKEEWGEIFDSIRKG